MEINECFCYDSREIVILLHVVSGELYRADVLKTIKSFDKENQYAFTYIFEYFDCCFRHKETISFLCVEKRTDIMHVDEDRSCKSRYVDKWKCKDT